MTSEKWNVRDGGGEEVLTHFLIKSQQRVSWEKTKSKRMAGLVGIWYRKLSKAVSVLIVGEIKKQGDENGNKEATEKRKKFKKI